MDFSPIGEAVLIAREGRRLKAYRDSKGIWTIGVGHTSAAGPPTVQAGLSISAQECDRLFTRDVAQYVRAVREALPEVLGSKASGSMASEPLPQHAFDALVSLCFNIGPAAFARSSVRRRLRAGDRAGAAEAILMWDRPPEILSRRQAEYDQFRTPYAAALPRARRGDARPVRRPATPAAVPREPVPPPLPPASRLPEQPLPNPSLPEQPAPPAEAGWLSRLLARLRPRASRA